MYFLPGEVVLPIISTCAGSIFIPGKVEELISEHCAPHMNIQLFKYHLINDGKEIIWWSERNGKGQYFLYDNNGNLKNAITPPDMVAEDIL